MIQSYKKNPTLSDNYDSIIIGSGMGSLTTAAILSKEGQKVLVLERHYTAGGFTHVFKRKGFEWDVGIHYIGEVQRESSVIKKLFDYISDAQLKWADMGDVYDKIVIGDKQYDFVKGVQNFKDKMLGYFPDEKQAIDKYVELVFNATKTSQNFYMDKALHPVISSLFGSKMRKPFYHFSDITKNLLKYCLVNTEIMVYHQNKVVLRCMQPLLDIILQAVAFLLEVHQKL
jgi:all-trans-retinol 13,14-reductase